MAKRANPWVGLVNLLISQTTNTMVSNKSDNGQDHPSGSSKWMTAGLGTGPGAVWRSSLTPRLEAGSRVSQRISLPSGRWDHPTGSMTIPVKTISKGTMTRRGYPGLNVKTNSVSTQTSNGDWYEAYKGTSTRSRRENPQVVIELMIFENSAIRVELEEIVLIPQPAIAQGGDIGNDNVENDGPPSPIGEGVNQVEEGPNTPPRDEREMMETAPRPSLDSQAMGAPMVNPEPIGIEVLMPDPDPNCPLCGVQIGKIGMLGKHFAIRHAGIAVLYKCRQCGRTNANSHSISCHVPKCKGRAVVEKVVKEFPCKLCDAGFGSSMGLTQHWRHAHPAEWNVEKIGRVREAEREVKETKLWSEEEVKSLIDLAAKYVDQPRINKLIADELGTGKSAEQVRNKRRLLQNQLARNGPDEAAVRDISLNQPRATQIIPRSPPNLAPERLREAIGRGEGTEGENEIRAIADLVRGADQDPGLIESSALDLIQRLGEGRTTSRVGMGQEQHRERKGWERRLSQKKHDYRVHQRLYLRDQAKLAAMILDGADSVECTLPVDQIYEAFRERWETGGAFQGLGDFWSRKVTDNREFYSLILANEVRENLNKMKNGSAPGPDGISKKALLKWDPRGEQLARLYTMWLVRGVIPKSFKECRTKLLPKSGDAAELRDVNGWRPVTIGSLVLRLFSRIMAMRLSRACPLNPRQRGFLASSSGCADNLMILNGIIRHSRELGASLAVVFVDFAKAFDSISHEHILCAMEQRQVDRHIIELVKNSYVDCVTRVGSNGDKTSPINMKVGVKQGDPMSPLLFNLAMDPLIQALEEKGIGMRFEGQAITTLAFADDLVLLSSSVRGMGRNLEILESFCQRTGLKVQPRKCHGFLLDKGTVNDCQPWEIGGTPIHLIEPGKTVRYLGVEVGPGQGIVAPDLTSQLQEWITRIKKAPLKPSQKVKVLNSFALPRLIYTTDHCDVGTSTLATLDGMVRKAVKAWLHLAPSTCNGLLYSRNKDGGMGIVKLESLIPSIQARRIYRLSRSVDQWTRKITVRTIAQSEWRRRWLLVGEDPEEVPKLGIENGPNADESSLVLKDWRQEENRAWLALQVQGVGADQFRGDRISNSWLSDPTKVGFRQRHYIAGLALRAGTYPTREFLSRGRNKEGAACRRCQARLESCSHILGQCPYVKGSRVRRHHKICDLLAIEAERAGWKAIREFRVETPEGGLRIPDLVCTKASTALVLDVTIRYEMEPDTLLKAAEEKEAYYKPIAPQIAAMVGAETVRVWGFPVGARGKWPSCNNKVLTDMGVTVGRRESFARLVSRRALLYSLDVLRDFLC